MQFSYPLRFKTYNKMLTKFVLWWKTVFKPFGNNNTFTKLMEGTNTLTNTKTDITTNRLNWPALIEGKIY